ncbi:hypothetical protein [Laceyella putida]|uniref:Uncharacterized protein n=1 Tax=Laceyella putida TaxID=110101 RepID=A0ABW2RK45_9BACL
MKKAEKTTSPFVASSELDRQLYNSILKKNIVRLSRKLDLEISEDIGPLIDKLLSLGLLKDHEIRQLKELN